MWFKRVLTDDDDCQVGGFENEGRTIATVGIGRGDVRGLSCELGLSDAEQTRLRNGEEVEIDRGDGVTAWHGLR